MQIEHPVGIAYDNVSPANLAWLEELADYGKSKGVGLASYELMIASRGRGAPVDCIGPTSGKPGSLFGQSVCVASGWSDDCFPKSVYENACRGRARLLPSLNGSGNDPPNGSAGSPRPTTTGVFIHALSR